MVALVIGSASGIGAAAAKALAHRGAQVMLADINLDAAKDTAKKIETLGGIADAIRCDVREEIQIKAAIGATVNRWGGLDILHNNAAAMQLVPTDGPIADVDIDHWDDTFRVNLRGQMLGCKHAVPHLIRRGGGSIINTSSASGRLGDLAVSAYGIAKAGTDQLTRTVATQYGQYGIRCNGVVPGLIDVDRDSSGGLGSEHRELLASHQLLPHRGAAEDVANAVSFLAGPESRFITGQLLVIDGGLSSHMPTYADVRRANP